LRLVPSERSDLADDTVPTEPEPEPDLAEDAGTDDAGAPSGSGHRRRLAVAVLVVAIALAAGAVLLTRSEASAPSEAMGPATSSPEVGDTVEDDPSTSEQANPTLPPVEGTGPTTPNPPATPGPAIDPVDGGQGETITSPGTPGPDSPPTSVEQTAPVPTTAPAPQTRSGVVNGCNTYGEDCGANPLYGSVPPPGYDHNTFPHVGTVAHGQQLEARCWARGGTTYNYAAFYDPPDRGPDPYASDIYYQVRFGGQWRWIADTYFVRDPGGFGLPAC
jgi:hypothetical protein